MQKFQISLIFFFLYAFSFEDTDNPQDIKTIEGVIFIPISYFYSLTNIQLCFCKFASEMTTF